MKFFNVDQHISVVADLKDVWRAFGHRIEDWTLSGHAFVLGRKDNRKDIPEMADDNWCAVSNEDKWAEVEAKYRPQWEKYDAFVTGHPPLFGRLYENMGKPVVVHIPIRIDYAAHTRPDLLDKFFSFLRKGNVVLSSNNKFDKAYAEAFLDKHVEHCPSLCRYTGMRYHPTNPMILAYEHAHMPELDRTIFINKHEALKAGHSWQDVAEYRAVVHFPYQISTMSLFEQYTAQCPILIPSKDFMLKLWKDKRVLEHITPYTCWHTAPGTIYPFAKQPMYDPNLYDDDEAFMYWLDKADYYDTELMPDIIYFDSFEHLHDLAGQDFEAVSKRMLVTNVKRKQYTLNGWRRVFSDAAFAR